MNALQRAAILEGTDLVPRNSKFELCCHRCRVSEYDPNSNKPRRKKKKQQPKNVNDEEVADELLPEEEDVIPLNDPNLTFDKHVVRVEIRKHEFTATDPTAEPMVTVYPKQPQQRLLYPKNTPASARFVFVLDLESIITFAQALAAATIHSIQNPKKAPKPCTVDILPSHQSNLSKIPANPHWVSAKQDILSKPTKIRLSLEVR